MENKFTPDELKFIEEFEEKLKLSEEKNEFHFDEDIREFINNKLWEENKHLPDDISKIINENFWDFIGDEDDSKINETNELIDYYSEDYSKAIEFISENTEKTIAYKIGFLHANYNNYYNLKLKKNSNLMLTDEELFLIDKIDLIKKEIDNYLINNNNDKELSFNNRPNDSYIVEATLIKDTSSKTINLKEDN